MARRGEVNKQHAQTELERPVRVKKYKYLYLIVCEDENTEPFYFRSFKNRIPEESIYLLEVGTGRDPQGVVERAVVEREALSKEARRSVDVVWVVFDKDDADQNAAKIARFDEAFRLAKHEKFKMAFSNEVFELWLLLHLTDVDPAVALPRANIYAALQELIRVHDGHHDFVYEHGNESVVTAIADLGDEQAAMERADRLVIHHRQTAPIAANPVTYVQELLRDLYSWIEYFAYVSD
jgi:hypothetical protein